MASRGLTFDDLRQIIDGMRADRIWGAWSPPQNRPAMLSPVPGPGFSMPSIDSAPTFMDELPDRFNYPGWMQEIPNPFDYAPHPEFLPTEIGLLPSKAPSGILGGLTPAMPTPPAPWSGRTGDNGYWSNSSASNSTPFGSSGFGTSPPSFSPWSSSTSTYGPYTNWSADPSQSSQKSYRMA